MDFVKKYGTWLALGAVGAAVAAVGLVAKFKNSTDEEELDEYTDVDPELGKE